MKIVGGRRSINKQRVRANLVCADSEAGHVRYYGADAIDEVVVKGGAGDCGGVSSDGRTIGVIEDVVTNRDVGAGVPIHDLANFVNDGMIGDVSDFVPSNGDVVSRAVGLDA